MGGYAELYARSLKDPEGFWGDVATALDWERPPSRVLDTDDPAFRRWYPDGTINLCWNAVDRHVARGRGDRLAIIYDSPVTGSQQKITYAQLQERVARLAGALVRRCVAPGDRVLIYMPMIPEAVVAMLACARIGAVHSVVFGGFAAKELAVRIDDAEPVLVLAASCGVERGRTIAYKPLLDRALATTRHRPRTCLMFQRPELPAELEPGRDEDWLEAVSAADAAPCVPVAATDPLYILYTSGTTGRPKGVVRDTGGYGAALLWSMRNVYGTEPGEVFWTASDVGWVVGHSYIVYGPLLNGNTTLVYEGKPVGTPDPGAFWRVVAEHGVKTLFTAPTAFRAIRKEDPTGRHIERYDLGGFRALFLAGERCDPETLLWAQEKLEVPVIDHWWQTETGWAICANPFGVERLPVKPGSPTVPMPGYDVAVLDEEGRSLPPRGMGAIAIRLPLPPGCLSTLWRADDRYRDAYLARYPGWYLTGDAGWQDEDGYLYVMSRTDDVINVAGHRLSTGSLEEVLAEHPDVAEAAVIGVADATKGEVPLGLVVLKAGVDREPGVVEGELVERVRDAIGPVAALRQVAIVPRLPKTRSGKVLRATMKQLADGTEVAAPATIDDPAILDEIGDALRGIGYAGGRS